MTGQRWASAALVAITTAGVVLAGAHPDAEPPTTTGRSVAAGLLPADCSDEPGRECGDRLAALNRDGAGWDAWLLTDAVVCARRPDPAGVQAALVSIENVGAAPGGRLLAGLPGRLAVWRDGQTAARLGGAGGNPCAELRTAAEGWTPLDPPAGSAS